ncbi:MAG: hypothetical protein AAGJ08_07540 [Cyanobacteria bacterium P01_H01_bin.35]
MMLIPRIVQQELSDERSLMTLKNWIKTLPKWLIDNSRSFSIKAR